MMEKQVSKKVIFNAIGVAMAVAALSLIILKEGSTEVVLILLSIGLFAQALSLLEVGKN